MLKSTLDRMRDRSECIRKNYAKLVDCINIAPIDKVAYAKLLNETWTMIGAQKADIEHVKEFANIIEPKEMEEFRMFAALNLLYEFKVSVIEKNK